MSDAHKPAIRSTDFRGVEFSVELICKVVGEYFCVG